MMSEKEQLAGFSIFIMREFGMQKFLPENSQESFIKYPISGLRQVARDMVEATQDVNGEELRRIDNKLNELNLPTLTNMRQKGFSKFMQILSRNKIKNEEEWYLLRSYLESNELDVNIRSNTQKLLDEFEFNTAQ